VRALRHLPDLPTLADVQRTRRATPKPAPRVIRRQQRKTDLKAQEDAFREAVWRRDGKKSRASGKPLLRAHVDPDKRGEVHHLRARSTHPGALKYDASNGVLLSATEHALAEAWPPRLEIRGTNADQKLTFILKDETGREVWRRAS
jgi:hypothetical protein